MSKPIGWRAVKRRRSYSVDEVARNQGVSKGTVRRWIRKGLPSLTDQRPQLIIGADLIDFLKSRKKPKLRCDADEFFCCTCKGLRRAVFNELECFETLPGRHRLRALCCECTTVMHKATSQVTIDALNAMPDISLSMGTETLSTTAPPR